MTEVRRGRRTARTKLFTVGKIAEDNKMRRTLALIEAVEQYGMPCGMSVTDILKEAAALRCNPLFHLAAYVRQEANGKGGDIHLEKLADSLHRQIKVNRA